MKNTLCTFILAACGTAAIARTNTDINIVGHVLDAKTGEHLPYVTLSLKGTAIAVMSDATGHFHLKNLPEGSHTIAAAVMGYLAQEQQMVLEKDKTYEVNFSLAPDAVDVGQVVVSASRGVSSRAEAPAVVGVVPARMFENTQSVTLAEGIRFQPGLRVEYTCTNCGMPQLRINGLEGQYSQLLLDSRPLFSSLASVYGLEQLPAAMIDRVEVMRGGGSALYGSNAIGGVVNIITKEPLLNTLQISNSSAFTHEGTYDINTALNTSFVSDDYRAGAYVFGMLRSRSIYDRDNDGFSDIPELKSETLGFRSYYKTGDYSKFTLEYHHIREYRRGGDSVTRPPHESSIAEQLQHGINGGGVQWSVYSRNSLHKGSVYANYQDVRRQSYFGTNKNPDAYGSTSDQTAVAGAQYAFFIQKMPLAPAELTAGIEYHYNRLHDQLLGYGRDIIQRSSTFGGYVQNEWKSKPVNLAVGLRLDKNSHIASPVLAPRANVRYTPIEHIILRAGYTSGYRPPQMYDEDLHVGAVGGKVSLVSVSEDLKPEYSRSATASADFYFGMGRVQGNVLAEGFYTKLNDVFALTPKGVDGAGNQLLERRNAAGSVVAGINLEAKLALTDKNYLQCGYTFQSSRYDEPHRWSETAAPVREMLRSPSQYGYAVVSISPFRDFLFVANLSYTGRMLVPHFAGVIPADRVETTPHFFDIGIKHAYNLRLTDMFILQINFGIKNILNSYQKDLDTGIQRDSKYIYGPAIPRMTFVGVKVVM